MIWQGIEACQGITRSMREQYPHEAHVGTCAIKLRDFAFVLATDHPPRLQIILIDRHKSKVSGFDLT